METELHALNPHQEFLDGENFRLYFQGTLKLLENKKINQWWLVPSPSFNSCTGYEETTTWGNSLKLAWTTLSGNYHFKQVSNHGHSRQKCSRLYFEIHKHRKNYLFSVFCSTCFNKHIFKEFSCILKAHFECSQASCFAYKNMHWSILKYISA